MISAINDIFRVASILSNNWFCIPVLLYLYLQSYILAAPTTQPSKPLYDYITFNNKSETKYIYIVTLPKLQPKNLASGSIFFAS